MRLTDPLARIEGQTGSGWAAAVVADSHSGIPAVRWQDMTCLLTDNGAATNETASRSRLLAGR